MPQNKFATEPQVQVVEQPYFENAERVNGQLAMLGIVAAIGSYIVTGPVSYTHLTLPTICSV